MLIRSEYKDEICRICQENHLLVLLSEISLDGEDYLNITYGSVYLKPILKKMNIDYFD